jgi:glucose-6-phosphate isomerase
VIALKLKMVEALKANPGKPFTADELATAIGAPEKTELVFKVLEHLAANKSSGVKKRAKSPWYASTYRM